MKMIVCVSANFGIGKGGDLLFSLPPDMKFFRETTLNKVVVMGRSTLDSFPGGKPLKNRTNIVISRNKDFSREGAAVLHSKEEVLSYIKRFDTDDVYIIGGAQIYEMFRGECDTAYVTKVEKEAECDKFFFDIDSDESWTLASQSEKMEYEGTRFSFCTYKRV